MAIYSSTGTTEHCRTAVVTPIRVAQTALVAFIVLSSAEVSSSSLVTGATRVQVVNSIYEPSENIQANSTSVLPVPTMRGIADLAKVHFGTTLSQIPQTLHVPYEFALEELEALPENWDGQDAEPVSKQAISIAKSFLASLGSVVNTFEPFADPDGSVGLQGEIGRKKAYITISSKGEFAYVIRTGNTVHRGKDVDAATMRNLLDVLY